MDPNLEIISESSKIARCVTIFETIAFKPAHLKVEWLKEKHFFAIPVESAGHFTWKDATLIEAALKNNAVSQCLAIASEELAEVPQFISFTPNKQNLLSFSRECGHFNFLLTSEDMVFAILCTVFDYFLVAGAEKFVEDAVGGSVLEARINFKKFASQSGDRRLDEIYFRYEKSETTNFNGLPP